MLPGRMNHESDAAESVGQQVEHFYTQTASLTATSSSVNFKTLRLGRDAAESVGRCRAPVGCGPGPPLGAAKGARACASTGPARGVRTGQDGPSARSRRPGPTTRVPLLCTSAYWIRLGYVTKHICLGHVTRHDRAQSRVFTRHVGT
jgi:hypothetical protein